MCICSDVLASLVFFTVLLLLSFLLLLLLLSSSVMTKHSFKTGAPRMVVRMGPFKLTKRSMVYQRALEKLPAHSFLMHWLKTVPNAECVYTLPGAVSASCIIQVKAVRRKAVHYIITAKQKDGATGVDYLADFDFLPRDEHTKHSMPLKQAMLFMRAVVHRPAPLSG
jgi:hypothetical protein